MREKRTNIACVHAGFCIFWWIRCDDSARPVKRKSAISAHFLWLFWKNRKFSPEKFNSEPASKRAEFSNVHGC